MVLRLGESTRLRGLIERVTPLLAQLEHCGVTGLGDPRIDDVEPFIRYEKSSTAQVEKSVIEACFASGIDTAWAYPAEADEPVVVFERRSRHGSGQTEYLVTEEVNRAARVKAVVLGRAAALRRDARHLFVWLDPDLCGEGIEFAMWSGHPGAAPSPALPDPIDHAWVAMWSLTPGEGIGYVNVWDAVRGGEWRHATPPSPS